VRAGLELIAAVSAHKHYTPLQTRVGIATGLVVVGDLIGAGEAQERGIVGETPNLARPAKLRRPLLENQTKNSRAGLAATPSNPRAYTSAA
jgi:class 3 adenylate cyclase